MPTASATPPRVPKKIGSLEDVIPFCYLTRAKRTEIESKLRYREYDPGEVVIRKGGSGDADRCASGCSDMYIAIAGAFVCYDEDGCVLNDSVMSSGSYFGERSAIFGSSPVIEVRAMVGGQHGERSDSSSRAFLRSSAWSLQGSVLLDLLTEHHARFALALASDLRYKQGLFDSFLAFRSVAFSSFHGEARHGSNGALDLPQLVRSYKKLHSAIHPFGNDPRTVDYGGWGYALRRLPHNITSVYSVVCSRRPISVLTVSTSAASTSRGGNGGSALAVAASGGGDDDDMGESEYIVARLSPGRPVKTDERRRTCWEVMPGKVFILLRELTSDYLDVLTCFCVHSIESRKLRKRLQPLAYVVPALKDGVRRIEELGTGDIGSPAKAREIEQIESEVLSRISCHGGLDARDLEGIRRLWPRGSVLSRLLEVLIHHGDYSFVLDSTSNAYSVTAEERWCCRVRAAAASLVGEFENSTESDLVVDVISSNTHSVLNCLSPYIHSHREEIMAWGRENAPEFFAERMEYETDRLYPLAKKYFDTKPEEKARAKEMQRRAGIEELHEKGLTGISVQLIDINKLKSFGGSFDDALPAECTRATMEGGRRHLLINIDYAFGSQGEGILRLLLLTFGQLVRSINVTGKAGGLAPGCRRGDILFPTHILDENQNGEMRSVDNSDLDPEVLSAMSRRKVHVGPVITVLGTILQSRELLLFYERLWHASGMEMEASWYLRAIEEATNLGLLPLACRTRFLYYVSDTPLQTESSLAAKMTILEGVPPLYAITRIILGKVFNVEDYVGVVEDISCANPDVMETPNGVAAPKKNGKERWADLRNVVRVVNSRPSRTLVRRSFSAKPNTDLKS